jgi:hypothetical protein
MAGQGHQQQKSKASMHAVLHGARIADTGQFVDDKQQRTEYQLTLLQRFIRPRFNLTVQGSAQNNRLHPIRKSLPQTNKQQQQQQHR